MESAGSVSEQVAEWTQAGVSGPGVLLIVENLSVPADRRVWQEAKALQRAGYRVSVISPCGRHVDKETFELKEDIAIHRFRLPFTGALKFHFFFEYAWALTACWLLSLRILFGRGFESIHVANPPDLFFPLAWFYKPLGKRFLFDMHDLSPETYLSKFKARKGLLYHLLLWCEARTLNASDAVIVTNQSYREIILGRHDIEDDRIFIVRNSPNLALFQPRPPKPELKEGHAYLVSYIGVMGHQDGVDYLLRAARHLRYGLGRKDVFFVIMGTGDAWEDLQKLHRELELQDFVRFTGRIDDEPMWEYLSTADVGAAPDPYSPLNDISTMNKVMEYMAMGKPVVSFDLRESRYSAQDAGVFVPDNNEEAFARAILDLLDDPERRRQMGERGRQRIAGRLSWQHSEDNLRAAYRRALGRKAVTGNKSSRT